MRAVIQRVKKASVNILPDNYERGRIGAGLLVLVAVEDSDNPEDIKWLASKICGLRIFEDGEGKMNLSVLDVGGEILTVSQFTLYNDGRLFNKRRASDDNYRHKTAQFIISKLTKKRNLSVYLCACAAYLSGQFFSFLGGRR